MLRTKKTLAWVVLIIAVALICTIGFAAATGLSGSTRAANASWTGAGDGTSNNPYEIGTKAELEKFRDIVNGSNGETKNWSACAVLTADIDLEGSDDNQWVPIGNQSTYRGVFDGNGHTIRGLWINVTDTNKNNKALFYVLYNVDTVVKDLTVEGTVSAYTNAAGIVAENNGTVMRCVNKATVMNGGYDVGGVVGKNFLGQIIDCVNEGSVTGFRYVGGIAGENMSGTITGCVNKGTVRGGDHVGGVVGLTGTGNAAPSEVNDCVNTGTVTATNNLSTAGGVVGECKNEFGESTVKNCSNTGAVSIDPNCEIIGGVVGVSAEGATYSNNYYAAGTAPSGIYGVADAEGKIKSASNIIVTKQNMIDFRDRVNSGEYDIDAVLGADVDLEGDATHQWTPIANTDGGNYSTHYIGTFDGNGHTISGLYMDDANSFAGLFGYLTTGGVIKNLTVSGEIKKCTYGGGIVTFNYGGTVINCVNYVNITSVSGEYWAGGVVGSVKNNANVASGVFGAINCVNYGNIQGPYCVGGVVGYAKIDSYSAYNPDGIITGCVNYGTVSGEGIDYSLSSEPVDSVTSMFWIGGIVGFARAPISYCVNNGSINATGVWQTSVGGIVAQVKRHDDNVPSDFSTACCVNNGNISVTVKKDSAGVQHYTMIGGIIGKQESLVENCYNTGAIVQTGDNIASYDNYVTIGGVSGYIANEETTLRNCYNVGTLIGEDGNNKVNVDPLRGLTAVDTIVTGCHYLAETTDTGTGALTEADFAIQNNFDGWDFDKVWIMKNGRPNLFGGFVKYYDKNGAETSYEQPRTVLSSDEVLPANNLNNVASFGADYNGYYGANGATHSGWATIRGGEKVYDFGAEYAGAAIDLYPMYEIDPPTVSADGYSAAFDNDTHELTVTVTHDLGAEATYTYQWYKLNEDEYEEIAGATNATYGVKYVADSGTYKVIATLHFAGYAVDGEKAGIVVAITKIDPEYTIPTGVEAKYGQTLAVVTLSDGWAWDNNAQSVGEIGDRAFSATYTPEDTDNYNTVTTDVTVTVGKADPTYDVPVDLTASIGDTLSSVVLPDAWAWVDDTTVLNKIGPCPYAATFTPEDTTHYNIATVDLTVGVYHVAWDGVGDGTEGSPYVITNKAQLEHYRDIVNGDYVETENEYACAVLANDIDLNGNNEDQWIPIGNVWEDGNNVFRGVFDGNNKTISRLYINTDENDYESKGLFGVTFRATIKNLTVDGSVTCRIGAGIVARPGGTLVINCVNCATVTASQSAGGVAGFCVTAAGTESYAIRDTQIINCVNNGDVTGFYQVGGIAYNNGGDIYGCVNNGDILINRDRDQSHDSARAGGIAASSTDTIAYCVNNGSVTVILNYPYYSSVGARVGGICASQWINEQQYRAGRKILYCVNNGQVLCQHTSAYSSHGTSNAGGITGFNNCVVENCYNTANVTGTDYVGGICGKSGGEDQDAGWITNCYNLGTVTKKNNAAGAQIMDGGNAIVTECRYLADTTDLNAGALAQADFADSAKFVGWDFDKVWKMYQKENDFIRPHLFGGDVRYYNKDGRSITYAQPKTILCVDGILPDAVALYGADAFGDEYVTLYYKPGYVQDGWATEFGGEKVYDFGEEYTGESDLELYPAYISNLTGLTATIGDTLSSVVLPDGWAWVDGTTVISKVGPCLYEATYNGAATKLEVGVYHAAWDGEGTGTSSDPYIITTKAQLEHFRDIVNGYYVQETNIRACAKLANNIDLAGSDSDQWAPIGDFDTGAFKGIFDGNNKTISGLYIDNDKNHMGLFGEVYNGTVKDLTVEGTVNCNYGAGIASLVSGSTIINCVNNVDVTATVSAGGIAYSTVGIPGREPVLINCVNNGDITSGAYMCGGIVANSNYTVIGCVNNGDIRLTYTSVLDSFDVGGIVGDNSGEILYCVNNGNVFATVDHDSVNVYVGGIAGDNSGKILYCVNNGEINCSCSGAYIRDGAGGIAGWSQAIIENCYNTGNVTGYAYAGGINGKSTSQSSATIKNCYNIGIIKIDNNVDGEQILGSGSATVTGCHYLAAETNAETGALSEADFANAESFVGWDFVKVWTMHTVSNETRPYLFGGDIRYYDQSGVPTLYAQPKSVLDVDGVQPGSVTLYDVDSFEEDYTTIYNKDGYVHYGWATEKDGDKVYDFGEEYTGESDLELYPVYAAIPTGLEAEYGQTLSSVVLPDGWAWVDDTQSVGNVGDNVFQAIYNSVSTADVTVTVGQKDLTIAVNANQSKTYGANDPVLTYTADGLVGTDTITGALAREAGEDVDTYAITRGTLTAGDNYNIVFTGADFAITPKDLTITVNANQTKEYGANDPTFTYDVEGLVVGDEVIGALSREAGENVDTYAITQGTLAAGNNYNIVFTGADFAITPKDLTITVNANQTKEYGANDPAFTYDVVGLLVGDEVTGALSREAGEDVDTYAITQGTLTAGDNYNIVFTGADFAITKKTLTVTAKAHTLHYGDAPANNGATIDGFANEETLDDLNGELTFGYDYEQYDDVGAYTITPSGLASDNYTIEYVTGVLTVSKKTVTLSMVPVMSFEGESADAIATVSGAVNGDEIEVIITYLSGETVLDAKPTTAGSYTAVASIDDDNYVAEPVEASFVIMALIDPDDDPNHNMNVPTPDDPGLIDPNDPDDQDDNPDGNPPFPDEPNNPDNPSNPDEPSNPDNPSNPDEPEKQSDLTWLIVVQCVVLATLAGVFIEMIVRRVKKRKKNKKNGKSAAAFAPLFPLGLAFPEGQQTAAIILGACIVALLIADIILLVLVRKDKETEEKSEEATDEQPEAAEAKPEEDEDKPEVVEQPETVVDDKPEEIVATEEPKEQEGHDDLTGRVAILEQRVSALESQPEPEIEKPSEEKSVEEVKEKPVAVYDASADDEDPEDYFVEDEDMSYVGAGSFGVELKKSFMAKLIQLDKDKQKHYTTLKNELLSYKKVKSRISWNFDTFNAGRNKIAKFAVRGKTLCLYLALDPDKLDGKYKVEKIDSQKYAPVPCLYRIINDRRVKYAIELITAACERLELKKREVPLKDYVMPYETIDELLEEGRIKEKQLTATEHLKREKAFDRTKNKSGVA